MLDIPTEQIAEKMGLTPNAIYLRINRLKEKIKKLNLPDEAQFRLDTNFIGHIRTCIKLEVFYANLNGHKRAIQNIREICFRKDVQTLLRNYPKASFNKSQYIYNIAIKHKWAYLVYFLTWLQNKKKRIE